MLKNGHINLRNRTETVNGCILHIASPAAHTASNIYKRMEISIKRSPQH